MSKIDFKPGTMVYPLPATMVSCGENEQEYNIITIAWTGTVNSKPPMCYISVKPERHSHSIIKRTGEFVINLTTENLSKKTDWCGCKSGRKFNKWKEMNLTPGAAKIVKAPIIEEAPVSIECIVKDIIPLGSHDMFLAEVVNVRVDDKYMDKETGKYDLAGANPLVFNHGAYFKLGQKIGKFGYSVQKKKRKKKK
ncbi:MAG: flavin reductase family protein [Prolixibacteraceae bacterium]|nr:flavin reductase family protein [Prolixibacteraceae bacterium]